MYSITGDGLSTSLFLINEATGVITLQKELSMDVGTLYIVR